MQRLSSGSSGIPSVAASSSITNTAASGGSSGHKRKRLDGANAMPSAITSTSAAATSSTTGAAGGSSSNRLDDDSSFSESSDGERNGAGGARSGVNTDATARNRERLASEALTGLGSNVGHQQSSTLPLPHGPPPDQFMSMLDGVDDDGAGGGGAEDGKKRPRDKRRRGKLPEHSTNFLKKWLYNHWFHPYPSEEEKTLLCQATNLHISQINNWFTNARRRILPKSKSSGPNNDLIAERVAPTVGSIPSFGVRKKKKGIQRREEAATYFSFLNSCSFLNFHLLHHSDRRFPLSASHRPLLRSFLSVWRQ
jgi:hypothetical protein